MEYIDGMMDFIKKSPTAFHAVDNIGALLSRAGYAPLNECETWRIAPGGKYYVTRNHECCPYVNKMHPPENARKYGISGL